MSVFLLSAQRYPAAMLADVVLEALIAFCIAIFTTPVDCRGFSGQAV
jgi:hypothetical protein